MFFKDYLLYKCFVTKIGVFLS